MRMVAGSEGRDDWDVGSFYLRYKRDKYIFYFNFALYQNIQQNNFCSSGSTFQAHSDHIPSQCDPIIVPIRRSLPSREMNVPNNVLLSMWKICNRNHLMHIRIQHLISTWNPHRKQCALIGYSWRTCCISKLSPFFWSDYMIRDQCFFVGHLSFLILWMIS